MLKIEGTECLSEYPRRHSLTKINTSGFDSIAQKHKKRGFFLTSELSARHITGPFPGATRDWKLNTYGLSWDQIKYTANAFQEIAKSNGLEVG
jgi:Sep-tRNA:Cys-tRNA synthetase